jgi:hypothetical protein
MLFTFAGGTGHFLPLVPFARAAESEGHLVAFAAQPGMLATVADEGFSGYDGGGRTLLVTTERTPLLEFDLARELSTIRDGFAGRTARQRATKLRQLCEAWRPDILVCDEMDFGALVAAETLGIPHATVITIGSGAFAWPDLLREPLNDIRNEHGLPPDPELAMLRRHLILSPFPPSFRDPTNPLPPNAHAIRAVPAERAGTTRTKLGWRAALPNRSSISRSGRSSIWSRGTSLSAPCRGCGICRWKSSSQSAES